MDKPTKPTDLMPRSFGGVKNNFSASLQASGYEDGVPAIYGGDNLNYQLDATGKELDYCEKIVDFINNIPIGKTIAVDTNNKLQYVDLTQEAPIATTQIAGIVKPDGASIIVDENGVITSKSGERNIGEIITSPFPLTDAGLHLLDGSLILYGSYKDFIDYIASIYDASADYFCTEAQWQQAVTDYGVCGKFVYDSVNKTVRLPKYSNKIYTQSIDSTSPVVGNGKAMGLTDGNTNYGLYYAGNSSYRDLEVQAGIYGQTLPYSTDRGHAGWVGAIGLTRDGLNSGIIADLSNITTPVKGYYYIVIANVPKTEIEVDIDEIATDLNNKMDTDLSNMSASQSAKNEVISWMMPDYDNGISYTSTYTAPENGFVSFTLGVYNNQHAYAYIDGVEIAHVTNGDSVSGVDWVSYVPIEKGSTITLSGGYITGTGVFYPMKGTY